ncbi:DUF2975 domain-containing protein [Streptomyces sp. SL13]|uniref:DUF2975 domain-containing protein n=1 Tax=Streptantibioticus silvisoli TaxID=2705255 RepID=A0AA90KF77_9ACTN|nr:DUF2975 domain-containing protein [Streptantibioticus silvisoli]MDI5968910.1 DUF2975 domain-containing protein [Streptantibioticus silvisoli]
MTTTTWSRVGNPVLEMTLGLALLLVGLFRVLFPILGVTGPLPAMDTTRTVRIDATTRVPDAVAHGAVTLHGTSTAALTFAHPGVGDRLLLVLPALVGGLLLLQVFEILLRTARTFRDGDFFVPRNARRLGLVAALVLLIGVLTPALDMITTKFLVKGTPVASAVQSSYHLSMLPVVLAILIAAAAAAFRSGTRLRDDTDGLV